jgi:hypothetical protein
MFAAAHFHRNIFTEIVAHGGERGERRLAVHMDNARPHTAKVTRACYDDNFLKMAPYPQYSPDVAASAFFLFGHRKNRLQR